LIFKRVNRTDAESVFIVMQANVAGIAADDVVQLELTAASVNGVLVIQPTSAQMQATIGVADAAIANGAYGLVQVYGYRSTSRVLQTGTSLALGVCLGPVAGSDMLASNASIAPSFLPAFVLLESAETVAGANSTISKKIFIRCMLALLALTPALM
jgi:hypothetical protein